MSGHFLGAPPKSDSAKRSERLLMEELEPSLLFCWFAVWRSTIRFGMRRCPVGTGTA